MATVAQLSITPVKSLALTHPPEVFLGPNGVAENRRFFFVDERGELFAGSDLGTLVQIHPEHDAANGWLVLRFPSGEVVEGEVALGEETRTDYYGRPVPGRVVLGPWSAVLTAYAGRQVRLVRTEREGDGYDVHPVTMVSTASALELARAFGCEGELDRRRFRMLMDLDGCEPYEEDTWDGGLVRAGEAVLRMAGPVPRCVVTTQDPETGIKDFDTLKAIAHTRGVVMDGGKPHLMFGMYADVVAPGPIRVGDALEQLPR